MATYNPTPQEQSLLNQIKANESGGNYGITISPQTCFKLTGGTKCTASGAYQFINSTWQETANATGVGTECPTAASCPSAEQDINALYLLRTQGTAPWGGSAVYGVSAPALADVSGNAAAMPTSSLMDQLQIDASTAGVDLTDPKTQLIVGAVALLAALVIREVV